MGGRGGQQGDGVGRAAPSAAGAGRGTASSGGPAVAGQGHRLPPADVRWNFLANLGDYATFWFGYSMISPPTMLALYISYLTPSNLLIALTPAVAGLGWSLPQLIGARWAMGLRIKKWYIIRLGLTGRAALICLVLTTWLVAGSQPGLALALTFLFLFGYRFTSGLTTPGWTDMIAKAIPGQIRGRWLGTANFVGGTLGALGLVLARGLLDAYPFPLNFAFVFGGATVVITLGQLCLALVREPPSEEVRVAPPMGAFFAGLLPVLQRDPDYARFMAGRLILMLANLGVPLLAVYAARRWHVEAGDTAIYTAVMLASQTLATLGWGPLVDRRGSKLVIELAGLSSILAGLAAAVAPDPLWLGAAFALVGVSSGAYQVADGTIVIEFAPPNDRPRYVGLTNTAMAPFVLISPLLGGLLADRFDYAGTFATAAAIGIVGWFIVWRLVADPRRRHEAA